MFMSLKMNNKKKKKEKKVFVIGFLKMSSTKRWLWDFGLFVLVNS